MRCPYCQHVVDRAHPFCGGCGLGLRFEGDRPIARLPLTAPGPSVAHSDFRTQPLPEHSSRGPFVLSPFCTVAPHQDGAVVALTGAVTPAFGMEGVRPRDACARAVFTALDAGARVGVFARREALGKLTTFYAVEVSVDSGFAFAARMMAAPGFGNNIPLGSSSRVTVAVGRPIAVELHVQGPTVRALVDGRVVVEAHDPYLGSGSLGVRMGREGTASTATTRVICHEMRVAEVRAR